jgi:cytochrome c-type biogenesis protein CcmH
MKNIFRQKPLRITRYTILVAILLTLFGAFTVHAQDSAPTDDEVNRIAKKLYCPVCENTPLDVCPTEACRQWRELIRLQLAEGRSEQEIIQYFVDTYGARASAEPPNRLATYLVPSVAILLGVIMLLRGFQMWLKPSITEADMDESEPEPVRDPYVTRLEEELKKQK